MEFLIEAEPLKQLSCDQATKELYNSKFKLEHIVNMLGTDRPQKRMGFWESDTAFHDREVKWLLAEKVKLFSGWRGKDLYHFTEIYTKNHDIFVTFEPNTINIHNVSESANYELPAPETIDNLISYFAVVGYPLYWRSEITSAFGVQNLCSNKEIVDYYFKSKKFNGSGS